MFTLLFLSGLLHLNHLIISSRRFIDSSTFTPFISNAISTTAKQMTFDVLRDVLRRFSVKEIAPH